MNMTILVVDLLKTHLLPHGSFLEEFVAPPGGGLGAALVGILISVNKNEDGKLLADDCTRECYLNEATREAKSRYSIIIISCCCDIARKMGNR